MKKRIEIARLRASGYHSLVVTIPKKIAELLRLQVGDYLMFTCNGRSVRVEKIGEEDRK